VPEFEEMRAQLEDRLQLEEARVMLLRTVENLRDLSFNAENLDGPAAELDLSVERANAVTRTQSEGLFANATLVAAAFSEDVLEAGHNSEVMELGDNRFVVLRVRTHNKPQALPLAAVRDEIAATLADQAARAAVASQAQNAVAAVRSGTSIEEFATDNGFEWQAELAVDRGNTSVPREVLQRAFQLPTPASGESITDYVMTTSGDALVFELLRVSAGQLDALAEAEQAGLRQQLTGESSGLLDNEFQRGLRASADISVM
jgi:peptidyl-prolyl cis-trans isomerase D